MAQYPGPDTCRPLNIYEQQLLMQALTFYSLADSRRYMHALQSCRLVSMSQSTIGFKNASTLLIKLALRKNALGIAWADTVYLQQQLFDTDGKVPIDVLAHEIAHIIQFRRDGKWQFLTRYFREYIGGRLQGLDDYSAYERISYEQEARQFARYAYTLHLHNQLHY